MSDARRRVPGTTREGKLGIALICGLLAFKACPVSSSPQEWMKGAHAKDLEIQKKYGVEFLNYWYDEGSGEVFCLAKSPSKEAAIAVHREGHGLVADDGLTSMCGRAATTITSCSVGKGIR